MNLILPADISKPTDPFRCEPYRLTMMARACVLRQRAMRETYGAGDGVRRGPRPDFLKCQDCPTGAVIEANVGSAVQVTERTRSNSCGVCGMRGHQSRTCNVAPKDRDDAYEKLEKDLASRRKARVKVPASRESPRTVPPSLGKALPTSKPADELTSRLHAVRKSELLLEKQWLESEIRRVDHALGMLEKI